MRHIFIIDGGNAAEEFPFGSMLYSFSSTNGDHVNIQVCRRCKMDPCRCTMAEEKLLRTIKRKPVPYCSETMLENLRKQDTRRLQVLPIDANLLLAHLYSSLPISLNRV